MNPYLYFLDEISKQLISSGAKAVITSTEIAPTVIIAVNRSIPGAKIIVVDDKIKAIPECVIPFQV